MAAHSPDHEFFQFPIPKSSLDCCLLFRLKDRLRVLGIEVPTIEDQQHINVACCQLSGRVCWRHTAVIGQLLPVQAVDVVNVPCQVRRPIKLSAEDVDTERGGRVQQLAVCMVAGGPCAVESCSA